MRKLFLTLLCFLLFSVSANAGMRLLTPGGCDISAPGYDCDCTNGAKFCWSFENTTITTGTPAGCSDGDTTAAATGSPALDSGQVVSGTNALHINALDEYYQFLVSSNDLVDPDDFKITFSLYAVSCPGTSTNKMDLIRIANGAGGDSSSIQLYNNGGQCSVRHNHYSEGSGDNLIVAISTGSWISCEVQIKQGVGDTDHYLACGENSTSNDDDPVAFSADATTLEFGDLGGNEAEEYYLEDVTIQPCDKY